jgi:hypothetical protein
MTAKAKLSVSNSLPFKGGSQFLAGSLQGVHVELLRGFFHDFHRSEW